MRLVPLDGQRGFSLGLVRAAVIAVAAALTAAVMALLLPPSVFAAPENPPTAVGSITAQTVIAGGTVEMDVSGYFSDPDGTDDTLAYSATSSPTGVVTVAVTGSVLTITGVSATVGAPAGKATITVTANDLGDNTATQEFEVTVTHNTGPQRVGSIPAQTVIEGGTRTVDVSSYFSDPDVAGRGDTLTYTAVSDTPATAQTPTPTTDPVPDGVLKITGASAGVAVITVTARDIASEAAAQTFFVTVIHNTPPAAVGSIPDQEVIEGGSIEVDVSGYFSDPDVGVGDTLAYSATSSADTIATAAEPAAGSSVVTVTGVSFGAETLTVTATDSSGATVSQTIAVTVTRNTPPTAVGSIPAQEVFADESTTVDVSTFFSDPDGANDTLAYSATSSAGTVATAAVEGSVVTVTALAAGVTIITVTASDLLGNTTAGASSNTATQTIAVTVIHNTPPTAVGSFPDQEVIAGVTRSLDVSSYFSDPDVGVGDTLTYSATSSAGTVATAAVEGSVVTVTALAAGVTTVTVTATDRKNTAATQTFVVTVSANTPPTAVGSIPAQEVIAGVTKTVDVSSYFSDPDVAGRGDTLTYSAASFADTVATATVGSVVTITALAAGAGIVTVTATDSSGSTVSQTIAVTATQTIAVTETTTVGPSMVECTKKGTEGDDLIIGTSGDDVLCGLGGNDTLIGGAGDDTLIGGTGDDMLRGDAGDDVLRGAMGNDTLIGGAGNDRLIGGMGNDTLRGGMGNDRLIDKAGSDMLFGGPGDDVLRAGPGDDQLRGEAGHDMLRGGPGNDHLWGGAGNDHLRGEAGNDRLVGGPGTDVLRGGKGTDVLRGGRR